MDEFYYHMRNFKCLKAVFILNFKEVNNENMLLYRNRRLHRSQRKTS